MNVDPTQLDVVNDGKRPQLCLVHDLRRAAITTKAPVHHCTVPLHLAGQG